MSLGLRGSYFLSLLADYPFELTEDERRELADLESEAGQLQRQKVSKLRELAAKKGLSAPKLEDLKPECGQLFVEETTIGGYRRAVAIDNTQPHLHDEFAYLCASRYEIGLPNTCGWVKGKPREKRYDNIGPLCGSAGTRFYCKICGKMVGEFQEVVS